MSLFDAKFYDFFTNLAPDSISKLAFEAKRYGYSGIAVLDREINPDEVESRMVSRSIQRLRFHVNVKNQGRNKKARP